MSFSNCVRQKYKIEADVPSEDKPIPAFLAMIENCEVVGRKDLADQIHAYWKKFLAKYPEHRINMGMTAHALNSIKKHLFGGKEFDVWLKEQGDLSAAQKKEIKDVPTSIPKDIPAIAIPKKSETQEEWAVEAAKTKEALISAKKAFSDASAYMTYLQNEANELKKKIATYSPGGEKSTTKTGTHKLASRIPKWEAFLEVTLTQIEDTKKNYKEIEAEFKSAVTSYSTAPITTVAFEKKSQAGVENILEYILDMKDLDKQRELLAKLNDTLEKQKITADVVEAGVGDRVMGLLKKFKDGLLSVKAWLLGLKKSVASFKKLAAIRY